MQNDGRAFQPRHLIGAVVVFPLTVCIAALSYGMDELGPLDDARKSHPAIFVEGNVLKYTVGGESGYICNGSAEQFFAGDQAESNADLYREASLDARGNLIRHLKKGVDGTVEIRLSGMRKIYEYSEGKIRRVVCFVAERNVSVVKLPAAEKIVSAVTPKDITKTVPPSNVDSLAASKSTNVCVDIVTAPAARGESKEILRGANPSPTPVASTAPKNEQSEDRLDEYMKRIAKDPLDCTLLSKAAKINVRRGHFPEASRLYAEMVKNVVADEKMDAEFAAGLLLEAAKFEAAQGNVACALKYYRLLVRCDGLRRWNLHEQVSEANKNISQLLLK